MGPFNQFFMVGLEIIVHSGIIDGNASHIGQSANEFTFVIGKIPFSIKKAKPPLARRLSFVCKTWCILFSANRMRLSFWPNFNPQIPQIPQITRIAPIRLLNNRIDYVRSTDIDGPVKASFPVHCAIPKLVGTACDVLSRVAGRIIRPLSGR